MLPGAFSSGDALRCEAIARFAPEMRPLRAFADVGGPVLGICNGFQILTGAHLRPGALRRNRTRRFQSHWTSLRFEGATTAWTRGIALGRLVRLPVAHGTRPFTVSEGELARPEAEGRVVARHRDAMGNIFGKPWTKYWHSQPQPRPGRT